jgi:hypothetical protein
MTDSQKNRILAYIQTHGSITPLEALEHIGSFRLSARIMELKADGHQIENENKTGDERFARYVLKKQEPPDVAECRRIMAGYPAGHRERREIQKQIEKKLKKC